MPLCNRHSKPQSQGTGEAHKWHLLTIMMVFAFQTIYSSVSAGWLRLQSPLSLLWHKVYSTANTIALSVCVLFSKITGALILLLLCWNVDRAEVLYILKATVNRQDPYFQLCFKTNQLDNEQIDNEMFSLTSCGWQTTFSADQHLSQVQVLFVKSAEIERVEFLDFHKYGYLFNSTDK